MITYLLVQLCFRIDIMYYNNNYDFNGAFNAYMMNIYQIKKNLLS